MHGWYAITVFDLHLKRIPIGRDIKLFGFHNQIRDLDAFLIPRSLPVFFFAMISILDRNSPMRRDPN